MILREDLFCNLETIPTIEWSKYPIFDIYCSFKSLRKNNWFRKHGWLLHITIQYTLSQYLTNSKFRNRNNYYIQYQVHHCQAINTWCIYTCIKIPKITMRVSFLQGVLKVCLCQYAMHPFIRCIYIILCEKTKYLTLFLCIVRHSRCNIWRSWSMVWGSDGGCRWCTRFSSWSHMCSMGFKSAELEGNNSAKCADLL
jgi:hypothetical protein